MFDFLFDGITSSVDTQYKIQYIVRSDTANLSSDPTDTDSSDITPGNFSDFIACGPQKTLNDFVHT